LKTAYNRAIRERKVTENPVCRVKFLPEHNIRDRVLTEEEFAKLLEHSPKHLRPILICAYETGMRQGEILCLKWNEVDLARGFISLLPGQTKSGDGRKIPISPRLKELLEALPKSYSHVFTYNGHGVVWVKRSFNRAREQAGLKDFRFHDLRHTFVTKARRAGVPDRVIMKITGHKTFSMLQRYDSIDEEDLKKAVGG
jgi:integrase